MMRSSNEPTATTTNGNMASTTTSMSNALLSAIKNGKKTIEQERKEQVKLRESLEKDPKELEEGQRELEDKQKRSRLLQNSFVGTASTNNTTPVDAKSSAVLPPLERQVSALANNSILLAQNEGKTLATHFKANPQKLDLNPALKFADDMKYEIVLAFAKEYSKYLCTAYKEGKELKIKDIKSIESGCKTIIETLVNKKNSTTIDCALAESLRQLSKISIGCFHHYAGKIVQDHVETVPRKAQVASLMFLAELLCLIITQKNELTLAKQFIDYIHKEAVTVFSDYPKDKNNWSDKKEHNYRDFVKSYVEYARDIRLNLSPDLLNSAPTPIKSMQRS